MYYRYLLAFGSNLGDRYQNCQKGEEALQRHGSVIFRSPYLTTEPLASPSHDTSDHETFLNYIVDYQTDLGPADLYKIIEEIENDAGHHRLRAWAPRHLDIDILFAMKSNQDGQMFYEGERIVMSEKHLSIPHPAVWDRPFLVDLLMQHFCGDKLH